MTRMDQPGSEKTRTFSLGMYLALVFGLSWPFQFVGFVRHVEWVPELTGSFVSMAMVGVATFVAGRYVFKDGFKDSGWKLGRPVHYGWVILLVLCLWAVPALVDMVVGSIASPSGKTISEFVRRFGLIFPPLIVAGFCLEFGWRGYLLPRLAERTRPERAVLIQSAVSWIWMAPMVIGPMTVRGQELTRISGLPEHFTLLWVILVLTLSGLMHGVVFAYFRSISGSLAVVTLYHSLSDGLGDSIMHAIGSGPVSQWWEVVLSFVLGVLLLWKGDWSGLHKTTET